MDENLFLGYLVCAIVVLGSFVALVMKFVKPINDLRVTIQQLIDTLNTVRDNDKKRDARLDKHDDQIVKLDKRVGKIETKMEVYHEEGSS